MKFFKNYKFILLISVLFIFSSLFYILYSDKTKLPNEKWSNEIKLNTYSIDDHFKNIKTNDIELIRYDENYYLVYFSKGCIFLTKYNENIEKVSTIKLIDNIKSLDQLKGEIKDELIIINFLEEDKFKKLSFDLKGNIKSNEILFSKVKNVAYNNSEYLLYRNNFLVLNGNEILEVKKLEDFSFIKKDNKHYISYIQYNSKSNKHYLKMLEFDGTILNEKLINTFVFDNITEIFDSDLSFSNSNFNQMVITYNQRSLDYINYEYKIDNNFSIINEKDYFSKGYNFNYLENSSSFIQNIETYIGKTDISSKDEKFINVAIFKDDNEKLLTKTKFFPYKAKYYNFEDNDFLIFSKVENKNKLSIFISSNKNSLIEESKKIDFDEFTNLFFTTFTTFLPVSFFGLIYAMIFLVPFFIIVLPINIIKLTWSEQNPKKLLFLSIGLYLLTKFKYIFFNMELNNLPITFTNPYLRLFIGIIFSCVAFYSMKSIYKDENVHFSKSFFTFFIIDITLFTLYFTPYFII